MIMSFGRKLKKSYDDNIGHFARQIKYGVTLGFLPLYATYLFYKFNIFFHFCNFTQKQADNIMGRFVPSTEMFYFLITITIILNLYIFLSRKKNASDLDNEIGSSLVAKIATIFQVLSGNFLAIGVILSMNGNVSHMWLLIYFFIFAGIACQIEEWAQSMKTC